MRIHDGHIHIIQDRALFGRDVIFTWGDLNKYMGLVDRVLLMPALENNLDSRLVNTRFFEALVSNPHRDRIWGYYWPHADEVDYDLVDRFKDHIAGIKYHPSVSQLEVDSAKEILDLAEDKGLPLLIHCGRNPKSRLEYVIEAYKKRSITMTAAHLGGVSPPLASRALEMLEKNQSDFDNFYLDTSSIDNTQLIGRAINVVGAKKLVFGTDIPFHDFSVLRYAVQQVWELDGVEISSADMRDILHGNIERIHAR